MEINEQSIAAFETILNNPKDHGFSFMPLSEIFIEAEKPTAKHILFNQLIDYIQKPLPKIFFYIIMDKMHRVGKADDGNLGYFLKLNPVVETINKM